jgi:hypothetical protein
MYFKPFTPVDQSTQGTPCEKGNAEEDGNCAIHAWSIKQPANDRFSQLTNKLARNNMSSSIEKNRRSVTLTSTERLRRHREKKCKNEQPDHDASTAEAQQQWSIPLTATKRKHRKRALKRQN